MTALNWRCGRHLFELSERAPLLVGIVNVTPDSFSDGGAFLDAGRAVEQALALAEQGADILDIGGESTRPGAEPVSEEEELRRVLPVFRALSQQCRLPLSIDTRKLAVARACVEAGAEIINDLSATTGCESQELLQFAARAGCGLLMMHSQGTPQTMQQNPQYHDVVAEVRAYLAARLEAALNAGVEREAVALDPGFGFGKSWRHNRDLLVGLGDIAALGRPVMAGLSRKGFTGAVDSLPVEERLEPTLAAEVLALWHGAKLIRTHDIAASRRALRLAHAVAQGGF